MACTSCKETTVGVCVVCRELFKDSTVKTVSYCEDCGVWFCKDCKTNWITRGITFAKLKLKL